MTKIVLDAESFKALASDTRLQIMKALDARPLTVSELSRLLDLNKATVFEHLKQLMAAELVKRDEDPARKWVYYRLAWKGKSVLHPENAQIFVMLGLAALGLGGALFQTAYLAQTFLSGGTRSSGAAGNEIGVASGSASANGNQQAPAAAPASSGASGSQAPPQGAAAPRTSTAAKQAADQAQPGPGTSTSAGHHWYDAFVSAQFLVVAGLVLFLVLVFAIVWTLYQGQRRERAVMRARIDALPADVNADEGASVV